MKKQKNDEKKNPLHREYGIWSNIRWTLSGMMRYSKRLMVLIPIGIVCAPLMNYLWTFISKFVIDMITGEAGWEALLWLMGIFTLIQLTSTMLNTYYYSEIWWRFVDVRFRLICEKNLKAMSIDFEHLENTDVMDCYQKAANATGNNDAGVEGMMRNLVSFAQTLAVTIVGLCILGTLDIRIVLIMIALGVVNFFITDRTNAACKKKVWDPLATWWRKDNYMRWQITDFAPAKDIRLFSLREWIVEKYSELKKERLAAQKKNARMWFAASAASSLLWAIALCAVYGWLIWSVVNDGLSIGNFSLYLAGATTLFQHLNQLLSGISTLLQKSREVDDFRSFMDFDGGDKDDSGKPVPEFSGYEFEFRNVSFKYPKAENYALKNLSLKLNAGERLAVVGLNGAGKSTFIKLLLRLYEPTEGEILLNGVNIREYDKRSYYRVFAPVFQDVELFAFPLAENVSMQSPENTDKALAEDCLNAAGFGEKLAELKNGVDTEILKIIHDDGVDLSGGEKQKLALARALYKNASVVVLDEPTAALDAIAESKLYNDFDKLIGDKTAVYISHRLSSTQFCKNVAMFKDGELCEYGTHESLMEKNGAYAEMFRLQAQYYVDGEVTADV
ncbi:MAG: ABC transporter ATP-binding protein [Oscillospiraceae bacterium]